MSDLILDVDQVNELQAAFRRGGWTNTEIKRLSEGETLAQVRNVLLGHSVITIVNHIIDCDAEPSLANHWTLVEHRKGGKLEWDRSKVALHLSPKQIDDKKTTGYKLRGELASMPVMNANVLEYLSANPLLIPEEWNGKIVFFWGTIYQDIVGPFVRCLSVSPDHVEQIHRYLKSEWGSNSPAVVAIT